MPDLRNYSSLENSATHHSISAPPSAIRSTNYDAIIVQPGNHSSITSEETPLIISQQPKASACPSIITSTCLHCQRPADMPEWQWQECLKCVHQFIIAPIAGISGYQGGRNGAESFLGVSNTFSWLCGLGASFGFASGFADVELHRTATNRAAALCSGFMAFTGAIPSAALGYQSSPEVRRDFSCLPCMQFIQGASFEWLDFLFAGANGLADFILSINEGYTWMLRAQSFFLRLMDRPVTGLPVLSRTEKAIMIFCALIIAYCAATSVIGYVPPTINLLTRCFPFLASANDILGGLANIAEWLFATNAMFTQNPEEACCWNFSNPCPTGWRENRTAAAMAIGVGLMTGLATASYTYSALFATNPVLAIILAQTAWTGGFWTAVKPSYKCFTDPCAIVRGIYRCCIAPTCKHVIEPMHQCCVTQCYPT